MVSLWMILGYTSTVVSSVLNWETRPTSWTDVATLQAQTVEYNSEELNATNASITRRDEGAWMLTAYTGWNCDGHYYTITGYWSDAGKCHDLHGKFDDKKKSKGTTCEYYNADTKETLACSKSELLTLMSWEFSGGGDCQVWDTKDCKKGPKKDDYRHTETVGSVEGGAGCQIHSIDHPHDSIQWGSISCNEGIS